MTTFRSDTDSSDSDAIQSTFESEAVTRGVRVRVSSCFDPLRSRPDEGQWFFLYTITIINEGDHSLQLLARHWIIRDEAGDLEEVRGPGVVGEQPVLAPGGRFEYTSGCPLSTPSGTMEGTYTMVDGEGERFEARIAPFLLSEPLAVN
jgi:ApaG protein